MIGRIARMLTAVVAVGGAVLGCRPSSPALVVGDAAPEFVLPGSDGATHRLSDYRGRVVVLAWFPKAFTGG